MPRGNISLVFYMKKQEKIPVIFRRVQELKVTGIYF